MTDEEGVARPSDQYLIALGRAVHSFQSLEWAVIWLSEGLIPGRLSAAVPPSGTGLAQYLEDSLAQAMVSGAELPSGLVEFANSFAELARQHHMLISAHPHSGASGATPLLFAARTGRRLWELEDVLSIAERFESATRNALALVGELRVESPAEQPEEASGANPAAQPADDKGFETITTQSAPSGERDRSQARAQAAERVRERLAGEPRVTRLGATGLEIYTAEALFDSAECAALIELIERDLYPSGLLAPAPDPGFRTSMSCNLPREEPAVAQLERRICGLLGIDPKHSETAQGQRYQVGQEFKPHHDFFHPGQIYTEQAEREGGQRTWTAMLFLNAPDAGGCTNFPDAGVKVAPSAGKLLIWNNLDEAGNPNLYSLHQGMPVEAGSKYVITKWFRERVWEPGVGAKAVDATIEPSA